KDIVFVGDAKIHASLSVPVYHSLMAAPMVQNGELKGVTIVLHLTFRTLPTKIGRIFSSRCRIGPWYTRKAKEFPHHGRSNSCYL
ncbi:hypothetical protein ETC01_18355, partial [Geobacillus sp. NFOSA3]|nr:hypothetical protein [Geobacillus sp. NFOSA3]